MKYAKSKLPIIVLLIFACVLPMEIAAAQPIETGEPSGFQVGTQVTVGNVTPVDGHFGTGFLGDNTSDMDIRMLLHDYAIVEWEENPNENPHVAAVRDLKSESLPDGGHLYTITLADGLTYNDGSAITASDYAFSLLLAASPELREAGGTSGLMEYIEGYDAYASGQAQSFTGIRLLSPEQFSIHLVADAPHFFVLSQVSIPPYPIREIAPGCEVADEGNGAYLRAGADAGNLQGNGYTPGEFSAQMLRVTLLDPENGYEFYPHITSGPYQLESFDKTSKVVTLTVNPNFAGNNMGRTPHIEKLVLRPVDNDTMLTALQNGEVDLLNKVAGYDSLVAAQQLIINESSYNGTPYLRSGFAFLSFACEQGPSASVNVRRAVSMCLDKDAITKALMGDLGRRVYGYYGLGQWMVSYAGNPMASDSAENDKLAALDIPRDIEGAGRLLSEDGWTLGQDGNEYRDGIRFREGADGLEPLILRLALPQENNMIDALESILRDDLTAIGVELDVTRMPFETMLTHYYRQTVRTYDMFFLSTNFKYPFDPYFDFHTASEYQGTANKTGIQDDALMQLAGDMRNLDRSDIDEYMNSWFAFQQRFAQLQPLIPLYSSVYIDICSTRLQGYSIQGHSSWARAIQEAWMAE